MIAMARRSKSLRGTGQTRVRFVFGMPIGFLLLISPLQGECMKPAPFEDLRVQDIHGLYQLSSSKGGFFRKSETVVTDKQKKTLWKMREFMGRWQWKLSPDATVLVVFGSYHFGPSVSLSGDSPIIKVYESGRPLLSIGLAEGLGQDPVSWASAHKLDIRSNHWCAWSDLFGELQVDWIHRAVTLPVSAGSVRKFNY